MGEIRVQVRGGGARSEGRGEGNDEKTQQGAIFRRLLNLIANPLYFLVAFDHRRFVGIAPGPIPTKGAFDRLDPTGR